MARIPRRSTAGAAAAGEGTPRRVLRENLPRPGAPVLRPATAQPGKPEALAPRRPRFAGLSRLQPAFLGGIISELRKVTWPSFAETRYLTVVVAIVATAVGLFLGGVDLAFGKIIESIFFN